MWSNLRIDIERVRRELHISLKDFKPVSFTDWKSMQQKVEEKFVYKSHYKTKHTWYWKNFKHGSLGIPFDSNPYEELNKIIDENELVLFFANEIINEQSKFWFYEGRIKAIQSVISETIGFDEYYIGSKKYNWLVCVNHHDILIGTGKPIIDKLKELEKIKTAANNGYKSC
jgi:hypothetical protein